MNLKISDHISIPDTSIEFYPIRSRGPGGQNVNKVSSGVHIRFDIHASDLTEEIKAKLLSLNDKRITPQGIIVIKAMTFRSAAKNREDGLERLAELIRRALRPVKKRKATRPTRGSKEQRLDSKNRRSRVKVLRKKINI
ncbi:MAG TPA: alternative ribosome rescue aminoacyl-tRNA hydrolase ArfB [Desulfobacter postgatei]|nr:alternative ribosome rescue aminoacyl-tRNA hydrolase ArfB [Desulfobacter sp.]HRF91561.1 alternative ribosome rescue aminoacyl-tRNA hydrolase ArfB [Desulfobacter postgatei]